MNDNEILDLSLTEVTGKLHSGEVRASEVLEATLNSLKKSHQHLNLIRWIDEEHAWKEARKADALWSSRQPLAPLHGLPLAHKDMFMQKGRSCAFGSKVYANFQSNFDATAITRLQSAGAYCFAGLNMAEFAQNGTGHNHHHGDVRNAWNSDYISGGSSSASGAAVASRSLFASLGSDTGGSVRLPAAANGITGLKPTWSRVSRYGVMPLSHSLDTVGPLARSARDCAHLLQIIAGRDENDPSSSSRATERYEQALTGDLRNVRIGIPENYFFEDLPTSIWALFDNAIHALRDRGAQVIHLKLPLIEAINTYGSVLSRVEGATLHADKLRHHSADITPHIRSRLYASLAIPGVYYAEALSRRGALLEQFNQQVFTHVDLLITPTIAFPLPTRQSSDIDSGLTGAEFYPNKISDNTRPINYLGLPAASVPCGFDLHNLPVGMQIVGRPFAEAQVLKAADAYQRQTTWHLRKPKLMV